MKNIIHYIPGDENKEYWKVFDIVTKSGKSTNVRWDGDYLIQEFELLGKKYSIYENTELGIQSKIEMEEINSESEILEEDLQCAIEDLAWWIKENLDKCPVIFRNDQLQEKLYKTYKEYIEE